DAGAAPRGACIRQRTPGEPGDHCAAGPLHRNRGHGAGGGGAADAARLRRVSRGGGRRLMDAAEIRDRFRSDGFVMLPDIVREAGLEPLRAAAARLIESCRSGRHTTVRRSPTGDDLWGAGQLFRPTCFEPALIEAMCGEPILAANEAIIGPSRLSVVSFLF